MRRWVVKSSTGGVSSGGLDSFGTIFVCRRGKGREAEEGGKKKTDGRGGLRRAGLKNGQNRFSASEQCG